MRISDTDKATARAFSIKNNFVVVNIVRIVDSEASNLTAFAYEGRSQGFGCSKRVVVLVDIFI